MQKTNISNTTNTSEGFLEDISERLAYLNREMALSDEVTNRENAIEKGIEIGHEKGLAEGIKKGLAEGIEKGLAEGIEKGLAEGIEKGLAEGIEKGLAEGIKKGLAEGIKKGLAEGQLKTRIEMIYAMIANGLDDERISRITKEPLEEVTRIRKEVKN